MPTYNFAATIAEGEDYNASQDVISYDGTAVSVDGTAKANTDYVPINLDVAGEGTFEYTLETVNDNVYEGDEVFYVDYDVDVVAEFNGAPVNTNVNGRITITIDDEEDRPTLSMETVSVPEGNGDVTHYVKITASNAASHNYTINISASGTASEGNDFSIDDTSIVMQALETEVLIPITIFGDEDVEPNETINLLATSTVAGNAQATFTIQNDDEGGGNPSGPIVTVSVGGGQAFEGPYTTLNYTVSESVAYAIDVTIDVPQQNSSQAADYTFRIPASTTAGSKTLVLLGLTDDQREQIKTFGVTYSAVPVTGNDTVFAGSEGSTTAPLQIALADELLYNLEHPNTASDLFVNVDAARDLLLAVAGEVFGNDAIHTSDALLEAADIAAGNAKLLVALSRAADLVGLSQQAVAIYDTLSGALDAAAGTQDRFDAAKAAYVDLFNLVAAADFAGPGGTSTLGAALSALDLDAVLIPTLEDAALTISAVLAYSTVQADVEDALGDQYGEGGLPAAGVAVTFLDVVPVDGPNTYEGSGANDAYVVDDTGDQTTEAGPEGGYDLVVASVDYAIGDGIEALRLVGDAVSGTGNGLANAIVGNDLANTISGGDGNDTLDGAGGDDTFDAGSGDNVVLGGEGTDTIVFDLTREELTVHLLSDGKVYVEKPGESGIDILVDVERVDVTDGALLYGLDSENLSFAYRIYAAAYGRTPDEAGLLFWTDVLDDRGEGPPTTEDKEFIASFFLTANEYIDIYGENPTNEEYINKLYQNVLHREADQAGYDFWLAQIDSGQGKDDLLIWFTDSVENLQNTAPDLDNGIWVL
jgi:adenosylcobinamide amidohydrolase